MISTRASQRTQALLMLVGANFFWGLSFPLIKAIVLTHRAIAPESGTWFVTACTVAPRFVIAALLVLMWRPKALRDLTRLELWQGVGIGFFAGAGMLFQNDGLQFTAASTSAFLTQLYAILIPVCLAIHARRLPPWTVWISCALVLAGVAILGRFDWRALRLGRGEVETLISSIFFMGQILLLADPRFAANRVDRITLVIFIVQAGFFSSLAAAIAPHGSALLAPWHSPAWVGFTLALAVFCTVGAYGLMNAWQPKITATEAGLIYCVEPVFGSIMALFLPAIFSRWAGISYPNEHATGELLLGGGLITAANVLIQLRPLKVEPH